MQPNLDPNPSPTHDSIHNPWLSRIYVRTKLPSSRTWQAHPLNFRSMIDKPVICVWRTWCWQRTRVHELVKRNWTVEINRWFVGSVIATGLRGQLWPRDLVERSSFLSFVNSRLVGQDVHDELAEAEPDGHWKGHRHQSDVIVVTLAAVEDYSSTTSSAQKLKRRSNHWPDQLVVRRFSKATVTLRLRSTVRDLQHWTRGEGQTTASIYFKLRIFLYKRFSCDIILFLKFHYKIVLVINCLN